MGRSERERRAAAQERLSAAGITPTRRKSSGSRQGLLIGAVVLVVAVVAGVLVAWQNSSSSSGEPVAATYPVTREGTVITAGVPTAPATVDIYEDFLCPACQQFTEIYGDEITTALNEGRITVNYHAIAILDERSTPPGYSTTAAGAGLCAADAGVFPGFHSRLFAEQPSEGGPGKSPEELVAIGQQLGAQGDFAACVNGGADATAIATATTAAAGDPAVAPGGRFGTPTVLVNGTRIDISDGEWVARAAGTA